MKTWNDLVAEQLAGARAGTARNVSYEVVMGRVYRNS